ncbi:MAG: hypothetical protein ACFE8B_14960 [Candidatus Hermodarchaeota archaeon]
MKVKSIKNDIKIFFLYVLFFAIVLISLLYILPSVVYTQKLDEKLPKIAQSQTASIKPNDDIQTSWGTVTPHWNKLDECGSESDPVDGSYVSANSLDHEEIEIFSIESSLQFVESVSQIQVHTYGRSYGNSNPEVRIFWNDEIL